MSKKKSSFADGYVAALIGAGVAIVIFGWYVLIGVLVILLLWLFGVFEDAKRNREEKQQLRYEQEHLPAVTHIADTRKNAGRNYELFCASVLKDCGYYDIELTADSGDFGADIVATDEDGLRWVVQCKYYNSGTVGVAAVQQVVSSLAHYGADRACVMTTSRLTKQAKQLAKENRVMICEEIGRGIDLSLIIGELTYKRPNTSTINEQHKTE